MEKIKTQEVWVLKEGIDLDNPLVIAHPMVALEKHTDKYLLSKEEIENIIYMAYKAGNMFDITSVDVETYTDNLFK